MENIWFIRTDKDGQQLDVTMQNPFIYSIHGICGDRNYVSDHKDKVFPKLELGKKELVDLVHKIKKQLIDDDKLNLNDLGKEKCDLAILYWLMIMKEGDIAFVRNKQQEVLVCKVTGYVSESFFDTYGFFQRPVVVLGRLIKDPIYEKLWKRTEGRKTIERNAKSEITKMALEFLHTINHVD